MIVEVYRYEGDRSGVPLNLPNLPDSMLVERGRAEINAHAQQVAKVNLNIVPRFGVRIGQLEAHQDVTTSQLSIGRIIGVSLKIDRTSGTTHTITVDQPV